MSASRTLSTALALGILCLSACRELGARTAASVDEYSLYRRYRLATTEVTKLTAAYEYLRAHPTGYFRAPIRSWFEKAEAGYLERSWDSLAGLRRFLLAVPNGDGASRAAARIVELELWERYEARRESRFDAKVRRIENRLARAERGRRELLTSVSDWSRRLASFRTWGRRTSEADHDFIYAFRLSEPPARCAESVCTKTVVIGYAIPEQKRQSPREAVYDVRLGLVDGGVQRVELTGPDLFSRIGEAVALGPIEPTDYAARTEAIARAVDLISNAIDPVLPAMDCAVEPVSPVLLHRRCRGVNLQMIAGTTPSDEDRLVVVPQTDEE